MISAGVLEAVKQRTDLLALIGESVRLRRRGRSYQGLCPFHPEKTPSFHVNPERGFFHCFGCKTSGTVIDFAMKSEGLGFPEAIRWLAERAGLAVEESGTEPERREARAALRMKEDLFAANALAATFFERCLMGPHAHPLAHTAHEELGRRGLPLPSPGNVTAAFRLGYAPPGWEDLARYLREHGVSPAVAEHAGLLIPRRASPSYYARFRHRLMFPVFDSRGRIVAFSGRSLTKLSSNERDVASHAPTAEADRST